MITLETIFERPVAQRLAPWMTLSTVIAILTSGSLYLSGHFELGHLSTIALTATDALVVLVTLIQYYRGQLT